VLVTLAGALRFTHARPSGYRSWGICIVDRPLFAKVMIGRGAVNQKGPEATGLAALHALEAAGRKSPVNIVLVAEGEEEIASPHFGQVVHRPEVLQALSTCHERRTITMSSSRPTRCCREWRRQPLSYVRHLYGGDLMLLRSRHAGDSTCVT
jgi:hypothetical protein